MAKWIELIFGMETSLYPSYIVLKEIQLTSKIEVLHSETLSIMLDLDIFATTGQLLLGAVSK